MFFNIRVLRLLCVITLVFSAQSLLKDDALDSFNEAVANFTPAIFSAVSEDVNIIAQENFGVDTFTFVISPLWLELMLSILSIGSTGETLVELGNVTNLQMDPEEKKNKLRTFMETYPRSNPDVILDAAIMMFLKDGLNVNNEFKEFALNTANMSFDNINFDSIPDATNLINKKISDRSARKIKPIIEESDVSENSSIIVASTVYFKGKWLYPPTVLNKSEEFKVNVSGPHAKVKMFRINGMMQYADVPEWNAQVVEIPYANKEASMILLLPNTLDGLLMMEDLFIANKQILYSLNGFTNSTPVAVVLPRFVVETSLLLPSKLEKVGLSKMFSEDAEFDNMVNEKGVRISNIIQKLKFWGVEGRGAFKDTGDVELPIPERIVVANRPFAFVIKIKGSLLFIGHYKDN